MIDARGKEKPTRTAYAIAALIILGFVVFVLPWIVFAALRYCQFVWKCFF